MPGGGEQLETRWYGRIADDPADILLKEVLIPQFKRDRERFYEHYVDIELALLAESVSRGVVKREEARRIGACLTDLSPLDLRPDAASNLADLSFAVERSVEQACGPTGAWRADRSRNDFQACAQQMHARDRAVATIELAYQLVEATLDCARLWLTTPMPGFTQHQPAQVITPAFFLSALAETLLGATRGLWNAMAVADKCPLGAGAMAGQELPWDRQRLAQLLGFAGVEEHALVAVASRDWAGRLSAELALVGVAISRFITDVISMATGTGPPLAGLPDQLAGISSAMPQKRNYPILERIRGRTSQLTAAHIDCLTSQQSTPFANTVEVSKEGLEALWRQFDVAGSVLRLMTVVISHLDFHAEGMAQECERHYLASSSLATELTLEHGIPNRTAHAIVGAWIRDLEGNPPVDDGGAALERAAADRGFAIDVGEWLPELLSIRRSLERKSTAGSTNPARVEAMLAGQTEAVQGGISRCSSWRQAISDCSALLRSQTYG